MNRILRISAEGWEYEPDQRHADLIIKEMNMENANGVKTLGEDEKGWEEESNDELISKVEAKRFRALAARANYLALDRPDIQYATEEVCRGMAEPTKGHLKKLRRLARYLLTNPRTVMRYDWQLTEDIIQGFTDSDWAGCRRTARSTSGGAMLRSWL